MSHTNLLVHIIFRTKNSLPVIDLSQSESLYSYIWGIVKNKSCRLLRINGTEDHVHMFVDLASGVSVAELVRDVKANSSRWMKESPAFPRFSGWAGEYAAFSYAMKDKDMIVSYIKNQRAHHKKTSFRDEMKSLYEEFGMEDKVPYFFAEKAESGV